jgi:hypothetical protein
MRFACFSDRTLKNHPNLSISLLKIISLEERFVINIFLLFDFSF